MAGSFDSLEEAMKAVYPTEHLFETRGLKGLTDDGTYMSPHYIEGRQWENQATGLSSAQTKDMSKLGFW